MKTCIILLHILNSLFVFSQWSEDFNKTTFTGLNINLLGDTTKFILNDELRLNDVAASNAYLSHNYLNTFDTLVWKADVRMSFSPSGNNFGRVYLYGNTSPAMLADTAVYLQLGQPGSEDAIRLVLKTTTGEQDLVMANASEIASGVNHTISVTCFERRRWLIQTVKSTGETFLSDTVQAPILLPTNSMEFGLYCQYTSSNATKFYFDNLSFDKLRFDEEGPKLLSASALDSSRIQLTFNEQVLLTSTDFRIGGQQGAIENLSGATVEILAPIKLPNQSQVWVTWTGLQDTLGNLSHDSTLVSVSYGDAVSFHDWRINEFMSDPSPVLGLSEVEYIELYNASSKYLSLVDIEIHDATSSITLGVDTLIAPGQLVLLSKDSLSGAIHVNLPSLNNGEDDIKLLSEGKVIDSVHYEDSWFGDSEGGRSLELVNPSITCIHPANWLVSIDARGGTPGAQNSVYDTMFVYPFQGFNTTFLDSNTLLLTSNLPILLQAEDVLLQYPIEVLEVSPLTYSDSVQVVFSQPFPLNMDLTLVLADYELCSYAYTDVIEQVIVTTEAPLYGDVVINEVLYDPFQEETDYIELWNTSDKFIALEGLSMVDERSDTVLLGLSGVLYPNEYLLISEDTSWIAERYTTNDTAAFRQVLDFPAMYNQSGSLKLMYDTVTVDSMCYEYTWHAELINDTEGISLERKHHRLNGCLSSTWSSASSTSGYGTPGVQNSNYMDLVVFADADILLESAIFSPDNDGYQDELIIQYSGVFENAYATLKVFDLAGRIVHDIAENSLLSNNGIFTWNGQSSTNYPVGSGIYLVQVLIFDEQGNKQVKTLNCTLVK